MAQPTLGTRPATWAGTSGPILYKFTSTNYSNAGYRMEVELWDNVAAAKIADITWYSDSSGNVVGDVSPFLKDNMSLDNEADLTTSDIVYEDVNFINYYIKYQEVWTASSEAQVNDSANERYAVYGGLQIGSANNLTSYVDNDFKFLKLNDTDIAIVNYPFTLSAIIANVNGKFFISRFLNGVDIGTSTSAVTAVGVKRLKVEETGSADTLKVCYIRDASLTTSWSARSSAANNSWEAVAYGNSLFVALSTSGSGNRLMTSPDGITWTIGAISTDKTWRSICYGNGLFVAVNQDGDSASSVGTSVDGSTWILRSTSSSTNSWSSVCYGAGKFVSVSDSVGTSNSGVMYSTDGINWTIGTEPENKDWQSVCYGNGLFVAVANNGAGNCVITSPDGITWTGRTPASTNPWVSVTYGNGVFVAVSETGAGDLVMSSTDGITWTTRTSAADNEWQSVTYGNGLFAAVSQTGVANRVMTSPDGTTWTSRTSAADNTWNEVCFGNGTFVAVASSGAGNRVMTFGYQDSEVREIEVQEECDNTIFLQWRNSLGGDECFPFQVNQEYTWTYSDRKAKRLTLYANNLTLTQWEAIQGLNTLGDLYRLPITEMTTSLNRTSATIGQSVYVIDSSGNKTGVNVIGNPNTTNTKQKTHSAFVTIEYPELFLQ